MLQQMFPDRTYSDEERQDLLMFVSQNYITYFTRYQLEKLAREQNKCDILIPDEDDVLVEDIPDLPFDPFYICYSMEEGKRFSDSISGITGKRILTFEDALEEAHGRNKMIRRITNPRKVRAPAGHKVEAEEVRKAREAWKEAVRQKNEAIAQWNAYVKNLHDQLKELESKKGNFYLQEF